jgi:hypothetical protein
MIEGEQEGKVYLEIGDEVCLVYGIKVRITEIIESLAGDMVAAEVVSDGDE